MQNAETVLDVLCERGRRGLPCDKLYRQSFNPQLYLLAYGRIHSNKGAMTPGPDAETADGMRLGKIERIIDALRHERYQFTPVRRRYIPKKDGKQRALGLPRSRERFDQRAVAQARGRLSFLSIGPGSPAPNCTRWPTEPGSLQNGFGGARRTVIGLPAR